jgi:hypothetical protein
MCFKGEKSEFSCMHVCSWNEVHSCGRGPQQLGFYHWNIPQCQESDRRNIPMQVTSR